MAKSQINPELISGMLDTYNQLKNTPITPSIDKYPIDHVFDEDKSVRWNREQVEWHNGKYTEEFEELTAERNAKLEQYETTIIDSIRMYVGKDLITNEDAKILWNVSIYDPDIFGNPYYRLLTLMDIVRKASNNNDSEVK